MVITAIPIHKGTAAAMWPGIRDTLNTFAVRYPEVDDEKEGRLATMKLLDEILTQEEPDITCYDAALRLMANGYNILIENWKSKPEVYPLIREVYFEMFPPLIHAYQKFDNYNHELTKEIYSFMEDVNEEKDQPAPIV